MPAPPTSVLADLLARVAGGPVRIGAATPAAAGWSADRAAYPWLSRVPVHGPPGWPVRSVVVKTRRPDRGRPGDPVRERVALEFLAEVGCAVGPLVLAHDDRLGLLVLEDLGVGPGLEDLLVGTDPDRATRGFVALAEAAGRLHAATRGAPGRLPRAARRRRPPRPGRSVLAGAPCWSRVPVEVGRRVERAYRAAAGQRDDGAWAAGMAAATAAWAVVRLARLPKLLAADPPHPMGFSRRGQLLDTLRVAVAAGAAGGPLPALTAWLAATDEHLRRRWPHLPPTQPCYPAYHPAAAFGGRGTAGGSAAPVTRGRRRRCG